MKQSRLSILQIIPRLDAGGAERTTIDIAAALANAGHNAVVVSEGGRLESDLRATGAVLLKLPVASKNPLTIFRNIRRLKKIIAEHKIALVHARSRAPAWSAFYAARQTHIPFVTTHHGTYAARSAWKRWYNSVMFRGDAIIANSEWTAKRIRSDQANTPKQLAIIPRGIDLNQFDPSRFSNQSRNALRESWGADEESSVVLLPGRLTRWKGQLVLIEALSRLSDRGTLPADLFAVIAGDAQGRNSYVEEIKHALAKPALKKIVTLPGHITEMASAYLAADIVISASTKPEAFGRVPIEAGAMGRAVIATDHGGAAETILPGESGLLVPPGDADALADALVELLGLSDEERREMGAKGKAHVKAHYSVEKMCADTIALYVFLVK
ncbi:MAG: glycosyltransferase family 4 protein [Micropepsaceae bacterium]